MKKNKRKRAKRILLPTAAAVLVASGFTPVMSVDKADASTYIDTADNAEFIATGKDPNFDASKVDLSLFKWANVDIDDASRGQGISILGGAYNAKKDIHVPAYINGKPVTAIAATGFWQANTNVYFEDASMITDIGNMAFEDATSTQSLSFPNLKRTSRFAFQKSAYSNIYTGKELVELGQSTFSGAKATNVLNLPKIEVLASGALTGKFKEIKVTPDLKQMGGAMFSGHKSEDTVVDLPNVTNIADSAFRFSKVKDIKRFNDIAKVGLEAFDGASGEHSLIFKSIGSIEKNAFRGANYHQLIVENPNMLTSVKDQAFVNSKIPGKFKMPNIAEIGISAFEGSQFDSIEAGPNATVTQLKDKAFKGAKAGGVLELPNVKVIGNNVFEDSQFTGIKLNTKEITNIGTDAFKGVNPSALSPDKHIRLSGDVRLSTGSLGFSETAYVSFEGGAKYLSKYTNYAEFKTAPTGKLTFLGVPGGPEEAYVIARNKSIADPAKQLYAFQDIATWEPPASTNTPPTFTQIPNQSLIVGEQKTFDVTSYFTDAESDTLTFTASSPTVSIENLPLVNGKLDFSKLPIGTHTVTIKANDGQADSEANTFTVVVSDKVNNAPDGTTIPNQVITIGEQKTLDIKPYFTDKDSDTLTYTATSDVPLTFTNGVLDMSTIPVGTHTVEVKANDGKIDSNIITFTVEVKENVTTVKPPTLIGATAHSVTVNMTTNPNGKTFNLASYFKADANEASVFKILGTDTSEHFNVELDSVTGALKVTPLSVGTETVQVYAENSAGMSTPLAVNVNITETQEQLPPPTNVTKPIDPLTMEQVYYLESGQTITVPISRLLTGLIGEPEIKINSSTPSATKADIALVDTSLTMTLTGIDYGFGYHEVLAKDSTGLQNSLSVSAVVSKSNYYIDENGQTQIRDAEIDADKDEIFVVPLDQVFGTVGVVDEFEYLFEIQKKSGKSTIAKYMNSRVASLNSLFANVGTQTSLPPEINASNLFSDENISVDLAGHNLIVSGTNMSDYDIQVGTNINGTTSMKPFNVKVNSANNGGGDGSGGSDNGSGNGNGNSNGDGSGNGSGNGDGDGSSKPPTGVDDNPIIDIDFEDEDKDDKIEISIDESENLENIDEITIKGDGIYVTIDGKEQKVSDAKNDLDFSKLRVLRDNDKVADSTVMHYTTDSSLVITSKNLKNLYITSTMPVPFTDIKDNQWYQYKEIESLFNYIIVEGTTATTYSPKASITRSDFAVMVARALELTSIKTKTGYTLKDLNGKWYAEEVQALVNLGIIEGFPDGTFDGSKALSRQQAAVIISRMLEYLHVDTHTTNKDIKFADVQKISDYAKASVKFLAQNNILVNGENVNFNPHNDLTRDHMAKVLEKSLRLSDFY